VQCKSWKTIEQARAKGPELNTPRELASILKMLWQVHASSNPLVEELMRPRPAGFPEQQSPWLSVGFDGVALTSGPRLVEVLSSAVHARRTDASGIQLKRIAANSGDSEGPRLIDNKATLASVPPIGTAKRPKNFLPRPNFQHPGNSGASSLDEPQWFSSRSAARYLDTSTGAIRNMVWRGHLTVFKLPNGRLRFKKSELDRQLESSRKQGGFNGC
jgi:hypothetical protein